MALVVKAGYGSITTPAPPFNSRLSELTCGEDLDEMSPCAINPADGLVYMASAAAANWRRLVLGWAWRDGNQGEPITLVWGIRIGNYATTLTPGTMYFLSATANGQLDTVTSANAPRPIAYSPDGQRLEIRRNIFDFTA